MSFENFYTEAFDFPRFAGPPKRTFILACSMRTGSSVLGQAMWRTGVMGAPLEYLNFDHSSNIMTRLGGDDPLAYWRNLTAARTSPNGVFGFKMFVGNYRNTLRRAPQLTPHLKAGKVIYLSRRDKAAQAVSLLKARQTGSWFSSVERSSEARYDFTALKKAYDQLRRAAFEWERVFAITGQDPIRLYYEDYIKDLPRTIEEMKRYLGVENDQCGYVPEIELLRKQADDLSAVWTERFREELQALHQPADA